MYNITRNYIYVMENSIYPTSNYTNLNILIMPLNSDLQFLTHAAFNSDYFMNIFNFYGFFIMSIIFYKILKILNVKKNSILISLFLFLSLSNIYLSKFNTKNDLQLLIYFLMILCFLLELTKRKSHYVPFVLLSIAFVSGIKWTAIFFLAPLIASTIFIIYQNKYLSLFSKNIIFYSPIILLILPLEISYYNFINFNSITGETDTVVGSLFLSTDGIKGMFANLLRYFISSVDLTLPVHKLGLKIICDSFDNLNNYLQTILFNDNTLGIANFIKDSVFFNYAYTLRPHSDFTFFGIFGSFLFICPFFLHKAKNYYQKILCFVGIFFIASISYKISWFPWNARYISIYFAISLLFFSSFAGNYIVKHKKIFQFYIIVLMAFNLFSHVPQPLIKHSQTDSWVYAIFDRENFKRFAIPEIEKVKKVKKYIQDGSPIIVMMENNVELGRLDGPFQSNYQIMREFNKSYIKFVDAEFKPLNQNKIQNQILQKNEIKNYTYIINFSNQNLENSGYRCINCEKKNEYKIYITQ